MNKPIIGITMGDPAGIGPEIILKLHQNEEVFDRCNPVVIGSSDILTWYRDRLGIAVEIHRVERTDQIMFQKNVLNVIHLDGVSPDRLQVGKTTKEAGQVAADSIIKSVELALEDKIDGILTSPANKEALTLAGYHYNGQAELFQDLTGAAEFTTVLIHGKQRVGLLSTHHALIDACKLVKKNRILKYLRFLKKHGQTFGVKNATIGVAALNPHGGDNGLFGREELNEIAPAIELAKKEGIQAIGPVPAQDIFRQAARGKYDFVLAMYHDQAAIAMDIIYTTTFTLGLPIVRTSVGHGTGFDIAGKGVADCKPMVETLKITAELAQGRKLSKEALK